MRWSRKRESEGNAEKMLWLHQFWLRNYIFALAGQAHRDRNGRFGGVGTFSFFSTLQCQPEKFRAFWFLERKKILNLGVRTVFSL